MKCPIDGNDLVMSERQGIEIDYCPKCRGVWLDRGELDKMIERGAQDAAPAPQQAYSKPREGYKHDDDDHRYSHKKKRKESLLSELFDF